MTPTQTQALFFETCNPEDTPVYTLKEQSHKGLPSLKQLYLEAMDPTEYHFALQYFCSWKHWERVANAWFFKPYITAWRKELKIKLAAEALVRIREEAANPKGKNAYNANKFLLAAGWQENTSAEAKRGRPSKDEIAQAADRLAETNTRIETDFNRIFSKDMN